MNHLATLTNFGATTAPSGLAFKDQTPEQRRAYRTEMEPAMRAALAAGRAQSPNANPGRSAVPQAGDADLQAKRTAADEKFKREGIWQGVSVLVLPTAIGALTGAVNSNIGPMRGALTGLGVTAGSLLGGFSGYQVASAFPKDKEAWVPGLRGVAPGGILGAIAGGVAAWKVQK